LGGLETVVFSTRRLVKPPVPLNWLAPAPVTRPPVLWSSKPVLKVAPLGEAVVLEAEALVVVGVGAAGALPAAAVLVVAGVVTVGASIAVAVGRLGGAAAELLVDVVL
jgi:hypothetical protein